MTHARQVLGRKGEDHAVAYLEEAGLTILDRNWRCPVGELDIVAAEGHHLVVVEVKTRSSMAFGSPVEAISPRKVRRLRQTAVRWLEAHGLHAPVIRFDVIGIRVHGDGAWQVEHVRGFD